MPQPQKPRNDSNKQQHRINEQIRVREVRIVGEKEQAESTVSVRKQGEGDQGSMKINDFAKKICEEVDEMTKNY